MTRRYTFVTAVLTAVLTTGAGCGERCVGARCDDVPDTPWDPDDTGSSDGYGYGDEGGGEGGGEDTALPPIDIVSVRDCDVAITVTPSSSVSSVAVAGEWSDWEPEALDGPDGDGAWTITLADLGNSPGEYAYKFILDGTWEGDPPASAYSKWAGGSENRNLRVGDCMTPLLQGVEAEASAAGALSATIQFASAADEAPIDPDSVTVTVGGEVITGDDLDIDAASGEIRIGVTGLSLGKQTIKVWAADTDGRRAENEPLFIPIWVEEQPFTWEDALLYFVFTDRFRNGDWGSDLYDEVGGTSTCADYNGGDFLGVIHALQDDYFDDLGVNALWLSPVYDNPEGIYLGTDATHYYTGYHGYWPIEPDQIEGRFADADEPDAGTRLAELIDEAHSRGLRVMFDLVLNHVHEDHVYVSEHPEWFTEGCVCGTDGCGWDDKPVECWFTDYLPDLDYKNHDIVEQVVQDILDLIVKYDVDAIRIDAAKHMDHVVMRTISMRLRDEIERQGGADFYVVGETYTGSDGYDTIMDYVNDYELDGQFDFPLYYAIRDAFASDGSFYSLESSAEASAAAYGDAIMSPFLGNHDVERFATAADGVSGDCWSGWTEDPMADGGSSVDEWDLINQQSMALAFTLTQPGVPLLYYGDEVGMHGGGDPDNRRIMNFAPYLSANQSELLGRVQAIGQARAGSAALRRGERVALWVDDDLLVYALDNGGGDVAIVAMNKGWSTRTETISVSSLDIDGVTLTDALDGSMSVTESGGNISLSLGSWEYAMLVPE